MDQIFIDFQKHNCSKVGTESTAILSVTVLSCCMSVIGTLFIMYTYIRLSGIRDDTRRLLLFLSLADLMTAGGILMIPLSHLNYTPPIPGQKTHEKHITNVCKAQSFVTTFSSMASFFWTFVIALQITSDWLSNLNSVQRRFVFGISHLICWGVPGNSSGLEVIKLFACSTQLSTKFIRLIKFKMPTNFKMPSFNSMINTAPEILKARNFFICRYFSFY